MRLIVFTLLMTCFAPSLVFSITCESVFMCRSCGFSNLTTQSSLDSLVDVLIRLKWIPDKKGQLILQKTRSSLSAGNMKLKDPHFQVYHSLWSDWHDLIKLHLENMSHLPVAEQRQFKKKLESMIRFSTEHYLVFLNTAEPSFNYQRMFGPIKKLTTSQNSKDLVWLIYAFEKEVRKFSSEREFKLCR